MPYLQQAKRAFFRAASATGVATALASSSWRRNRLLILCYHGVSAEDEHAWNPLLYVSPEVFRRRLQILEQRRCNVLPLGTAIDLLYKRELPPRSVALTFDDGLADFYSQAWPILKQYGFPATVYLTTYYVKVQHPVFDLAASYLAWKSKRAEIDWPEMLGSGSRALGEGGRESVVAAVKARCIDAHYSGQQKFDTLAEFAARLDVDFESLRRRRILHLMTAAEVAQVAAEGCDTQLHTHRHRVSTQRERFVGEIEDNRALIRGMTGSSPSHFCYPGGNWLHEFPEWLREAGVVSATTCDTGFATSTQSPYYLRRVLDTNFPDEVFDAWATGIADVISRHGENRVGGQFFADEAEPERTTTAPRSFR